MKEYKNTSAWQDTEKLTTALTRLAVTFRPTEFNSNPEEDFLFNLKEKLILVPIKIAFAHNQNTLYAYLEQMSLAYLYLDDIKVLLKQAHSESYIKKHELDSITKEIDKTILSIKKLSALAIYTLPTIKM